MNSRWVISTIHFKNIPNTAYSKHVFLSHLQGPAYFAFPVVDELRSHRWLIATPIGMNAVPGQLPTGKHEAEILKRSLACYRAFH